MIAERRSGKRRVWPLRGLRGLSNCAKRLECVELAPAFVRPKPSESAGKPGRTPNAPRPRCAPKFSKAIRALTHISLLGLREISNCAKRLECVELAPAFVRPKPSESAGKPGRTSKRSATSPGF